MRVTALSAGAALLIAIAGCGESSLPDRPDDTTSADFIDSRPTRGEDGGLRSLPRGGLPGIIELVEGIAVIEVIEIVDVTVPMIPLPSNLNFPVAELPGEPLTTYRVRVEEWIKGDGDDEVLLTGPGAITGDGPRFTDGYFLLEPGRRYAMVFNPKPADLPGTGDYLWSWGGWANFEVTDGFVHVLNNPLTRDLDEKYGGMPLDEFVAVLKDIVANPPVIPPPPTPSPTPDHVDRVEGDPSLVIERMAIDVGAADIASNTAVSLGARQKCDAFSVGDTVTADIVLDAVPGAADSKGGITGFQFELRFDPDVLGVVEADAEMLLAANDGSSVIPFSDPAPDEEGVFLVAAADFGQEIVPEVGSGVLARVTFEALASGISPLTLTGVIILDAARNQFTVKNVSRASVAIDSACPAGS